MGNSTPTAWLYPDAFVGRATLSNYEPWPLISASGVSSAAPASAPVVHWVQPTPVAFKNIVMQASLSPGVPAATSLASTGSEAFSYALSANLYQRQDYAANISTLTWLTSGSFGLTGTLGYSSTSQQFGLSWVTDSTGGTSNLTTTSSDAGWSNFAVSAFVYSVPMSSVLTAGEYWLAFQHSSSSATSNSNVTLLSISQLQVIPTQAATAKTLGGSAGTAFMAGGPGWNNGFLATTPTTSGTMAISAIGNGFRSPWFAFSNA